jgi:DNA-directed RNA polymerase specialized sigma24 family protein
MANEYLNNKTFEGIIAEFQRSRREKAKYEMIIEDLLGARTRREKRNKNIRRAELLSKTLNQRVAEYKDICFKFTTSQDDLASAFFILSENIVRYAKFHFIDHDDAVQEGVMICFEKIDRFDPKKGKAFNYMTTCILNHFRQLYRTARNYQELKKKYLDYLQYQLENIVVLNGRLQTGSGDRGLPVENYRSDN